MSQFRPPTYYRQTPYHNEVGKPPLRWCKLYAREYLRVHPGAPLREAAAYGLREAYAVLIDHVRESQR